METKKICVNRELSKSADIYGKARDYSHSFKLAKVKVSGEIMAYNWETVGEVERKKLGRVILISHYPKLSSHTVYIMANPS